MQNPTTLEDFLDRIVSVKTTQGTNNLDYSSVSLERYLHQTKGRRWGIFLTHSVEDTFYKTASSILTDKGVEHYKIYVRTRNHKTWPAVVVMDPEDWMVPNGWDYRLVEADREGDFCPMEFIHKCEKAWKVGSLEFLYISLTESEAKLYGEKLHAKGDYKLAM